MQVGVADPGSFASFGGFGLGGGRARGPAGLLAGGMRPTFLTSRWIMWPGKRARMGLLVQLACPVGSMSRRRFRPALSSQRVTAYRHHCPARGELMTDTTGGPLVGAAPVLDEVHRLGTGPGGAAKRGAGAVLKRFGSALAVTSQPLRHPWRGRCPPRRLRGR